jgi:hypothetical protein
MDSGAKTPMLFAKEVRSAKLFKATSAELFKSNLNLGRDHSCRDVQASAKVLARALGTHRSLQS